MGRHFVTGPKTANKPVQSLVALMNRPRGKLGWADSLKSTYRREMHLTHLPISISH